MSDDPSDKRSLVVQNANVRVTVTYTRRTLLAGAAAATAVATVGTLSTAAPARAADPNSAQDMTDFVTLSAALTGIVAGEARARRRSDRHQARLFQMGQREASGRHSTSS